MRLFRQQSIVFLAVIAMLFPCYASAQQEVPATLPSGISADEENMIPVSLIRGRVSSQPERYILGPGDTIGIKVQDMPEHDQEFTIRPDGYGSIHPFGELYISGTDVQGLEQWLEEKFEYYLLEPKVSVNVKEMRPALVYVTGAVQKPGTYQYLRKGLTNTSLILPAHQERIEMTLTNVLVQAGGVTEYADIQNIQIIHAISGRVETYNLRQLLATGDASGDVWLQSGDSIIVPQMEQQMDPDTFKLVNRSNFYKDKFPVVVLGAVTNQGEVQIDPSNNTLNAAIALAGGFVSKLSKTDKIIVQRPTNQGGFSRWVIDREKSNLALQPGDVLYITDSKYSTVERGLSFLGQLSQPFFFGTVGANNLNSLSK